MSSDYQPFRDQELERVEQAETEIELLRIIAEYLVRERFN